VPVDLEQAAPFTEVHLGTGRPRRRRSLAALPEAVPMAVVAALGAFVVYLRCPLTVRRPELFAEDGAVWLAGAKAHGALRPLFSSYSGYLHTFPRLVADAGLLVPLLHVPRLFVSFAVAVEVLPACFLVSRRMAGVIPSFWARLAVAGAYLCLPNSTEVNANLTNAQWHLGLLLFLVVVAEDAGRLWRVADVVVAVIGGLTGPFVLALAPIAVVVHLLRRRRWTAVLAAILAVLACVQGSVWLATSGERGHFAPLGVTGSRLLQILGGEVVGGTAFGPPVTEGGVDGHLLRCGLLLAVAVVVVGLALWRGPMELRALNVFAAAMLAAALVAPLASVTGSQWQVLTSPVASGGRYWYLPTCALVADVLWAAGQLRGRRRMVPVGALGVACLTVVAGFGLRNSFSYVPITPRPSWAAQVHAFDRLPPGRSQEFVEIPAGWRFELTKR
jgi:hypothetical protein